MSDKNKVYLIGSLRNPTITGLSNVLEEQLPVEAFSSWVAAGPEADDYWKQYESERGRSYVEALQGYAAQHVFKFDKHHLDTSDAAILVYPAGKSGHLELGYMAGRGKPTVILLDQDYDRWDVMLAFAGCVTYSWDEAVSYLKEELGL